MPSIWHVAVEDEKTEDVDGSLYIRFRAFANECLSHGREGPRGIWAG